MTANPPGVGCGAAILCDGRLLLVLRKRAPEAGHWGLPGGKVDPYEPSRDAVAREIAEEIGVRIDPHDLLCVAEQIDRARQEHWVAPVYLVESFQGEPVLLEPEALGGMGWFALDALPAPLTTPTVQALDALSARSRRRR